MAGQKDSLYPEAPRLPALKQGCGATDSPRSQGMFTVVVYPVMGATFCAVSCKREESEVFPHRELDPVWKLGQLCLLSSATCERASLYQPSPASVLR